MKRNNLFLSVKINNDFFLVPSGQAAVDHRKSIKLNSVGMFVWNALENDITMEQLLKLAMLEYMPAPDEISELTSDIMHFTDVLGSKGLLEKENPSTHCQTLPASVYTIIKIAGIKIKIPGDLDILSDELKAFVDADCTSFEDAINVNLRFHSPFTMENGTVLVRNTDVFVMESKNKFIVIFNEFKRIREMHILKDCTACDIFAKAPADDILRHELYLALRIPFMLSALKQGMLMLHSSSVLYKNKLYCFSAPAGTGKSTHAGLWNRLFDTPVINGDTNLLLPTDDCVLVPGTPWCGTSDIYSDSTYHLGGIVFLSQGNCDEAQKLSAEDAFIKTVARTISPNWNEELSNKVIEGTGLITELVPCWKLICTPESTAVEEIKRHIDEI